MSWIESVAVAFGILCVVLYVRQNIWAWPTGLVQVLLYVYIFYDARLYSDVILHVIYVGMQIYGWYHWKRGRGNTAGLPVSRISAAGVLLYGVGALAGAAVWGWIMSTFTDAAAPYVDAFVAVTSLLAQWLLARKVLESWLFWIVVDIVAVALYTAKELYLTAGLYLVFLGLAVSGYAAWRRSFQASVAGAAA